MNENDAAIAAAREAEQRLWKVYGLAVSERLIEVPDVGLRVRMLECGTPSAQPLVFVQGGLGEAFGWVSLLAKLTDFRCITLDRPGGGLSDGVDFLKVDVRRLAVAVLERVLDSAGASQAVFIANSMGGWWTIQFALHVPERVSRIALVGCPAVLLDTSAPLPMRLISVPILGPTLAQKMIPPNVASVREVPRFLGHPAEVGRRWSDAEAETFYRFGNLTNVHRSWTTLLRRFLRPWGGNPRMRITASQLQRIRQPTLFIWGSDDPFGSSESGRAATALMPAAQLEIVGVGHLPWWDDAEACARLIRTFVAAPDPAARV